MTILRPFAAHPYLTAGALYVLVVFLGFAYCIVSADPDWEES